MICGFDLNRFFNDCDLSSLLKIRIIILELQELIVVNCSHIDVQLSIIRPIMAWVVTC